MSKKQLFVEKADAGRQMVAGRRAMTELNRHTMFLREHISLPEGIVLAAEPFCDGWVILDSGDAALLGKKIAALGWNYIVLTDMRVRKAIARSVPEAIQRSVELALQRTGRDFNAAEIEEVKAFKRLWFYIAKATVLSRQIQESPFLGGCDGLSVQHPPATFEAGDR